MTEENLSFEEALEKLEHITRQLEVGNLTLEETLNLYEQGQELAALCEKRLQTAELRLAQLQVESRLSEVDVSTTHPED